jgi:peptidoglycan-associated lipoprotein
MLRRQLLVFVLIGLFILTLGACAKKQTAKVEPPPAAEVTEQPATPPVEEVEEIPQEAAPTVAMPVLNDVFFEYDKARLSEEAKQTLADNARQLKDASTVAVVIEGHCDERGTNAYNLALGERRAKSAMEYLVSMGVAAARITTISYGEERPFNTGHDEAAWSKNRRAHFTVKQ